MKHYFFPFSLSLLCILLLAACSQSGAKGEVSSAASFQAEYDWVLPDFNFIDQNQESLAKTDLIGDVWIANFVFTNCTTVCSPMTANMAKLQKKMKEAGLDYPILSFSVDPERDTPEALKTFSDKFDADLTNWHFLTGYRKEEISQFAKAFRTLAEMEEGTDQVTHSTKIYLINKEGIIVKGYDGLKVPFDKIITDLKALK